MEKKNGNTYVTSGSEVMVGNMGEWKIRWHWQLLSDCITPSFHFMSLFLVHLMLHYP